MEKLCNRCPHAVGCHLSYLQEECRQLRKEKTPNVRPNRAEIIANMDIDQMSTKMMNAILYELCEDGVPSKEQVKHWLSGVPEEDEILFGPDSV